MTNVKAIPSHGASPCRRGFYFVLAIVAFFLSIGFTAAAPMPFPEEIRRYDFEGPKPRRIALVAGNSDYLNASKLPGSLKDASEMTQLLRKLQFEMEEPQQFRTRTDFLKNQAKPFQNKIQKGDFVVFYFSGHGFTYGGDNYIAPLEFPTLVKDDDDIDERIFNTFLSESALRNLFLKKNPAFLLFILDACRTIGGPVASPNQAQDNNIIKEAGMLEFMDQKPVIKFNSGQQNDLVNGLSKPSSIPPNTIIAFASEAGKPAVGKADGELSYFTAAITKTLDRPEVEFSLLQPEITAKVAQRTNDEQIPAFYHSRQVYVWFNPTERTAAENRDAWYNALNEGSEEAIDLFQRLFALSPYAKAADQWVFDRRQRAPTNISITRFAAEQPETGWNKAESEPGKRIIMAGSIGPLAMTRNVRSFLRMPDAKTMAQNVFDASVSLTGQEPPKQSAQQTAELLAAHGEAVSLTQNLDIRANPSIEAPIVDQANYMQPMRVDDVVTSPDGTTWTKVSLKDQDHSGYVRIPEPQQPRRADIGVPIEETYFSSTEEDTSPFINGDNLRETLSRIISTGNKIKWVSIATAKTNDLRTRDILRARASHAFSVSTDFGVSRSQISIVEGADFGGSQIRVRFFGN